MKPQEDRSNRKCLAVIDYFDFDLNDKPRYMETKFELSSVAKKLKSNCFSYLQSRKLLEKSGLIMGLNRLPDKPSGDAYIAIENSDPF